MMYVILLFIHYLCINQYAVPPLPLHDFDMASCDVSCPWCHSYSFTMSHQLWLAYIPLACIKFIYISSGLLLATSPKDAMIYTSGALQQCSSGILVWGKQ
jgi:hypothetical protein